MRRIVDLTPRSEEVIQMTSDLGQSGPDPVPAAGAQPAGRHKNDRFFWWMLAPTLVTLVAVCLIPLAYLITTSFTPLTLTNPASYWNFSNPLGNYHEMLQDARLHNSLLLQLKLSFWTVLMQLLLGLGAAVLIHHLSSRGDTLQTILLLPMVLPPIVVAIVWKILYSPDISPAWWVFDALGIRATAPLTDARLAIWAIIIADTWQWFPFTMIILLAALKMMPAEWVEAARMDGAGGWQIFRYITLPYLSASLVVCGLFRFIDSIKAFPLIYILTEGGPGNTTEVTNYYVFTQAFGFSYIGYSSAVTILLLVSVIALSYVTTRMIERNTGE